MRSLLDAHAHLQDPRIRAPEVLEALRALGVACVVVNGTRESDWPEVASLARTYPFVLPSYGLHPWFLAERSAEWRERLCAYLDQGGACVGEIGLDRWIPDYDWEDQRAVFIDQLALAAERNLPVTIHCLKAWGALREILASHPLPERGFLLHAYGGPVEMVPEFVSLGAYFSFSGYFLLERKQDRREGFARIPPERLLVETDAPSMPLPVDRERFKLPDSPDGRVNHPANIIAVYEGLAEVRKTSMERLTREVAENFARIFGERFGQSEAPDEPAG